MRSGNQVPCWSSAVFLVIRRLSGHPVPPIRPSQSTSADRSPASKALVRDVFVGLAARQLCGTAPHFVRVHARQAEQSAKCGAVSRPRTPRARHQRRRCLRFGETSSSTMSQADRTPGSNECADRDVFVGLVAGQVCGTAPQFVRVHAWRARQSAKCGAVSRGRTPRARHQRRQACICVHQHHKARSGGAIGRGHRLA